jgi:hypothetical protein
MAMELLMSNVTHPIRTHSTRARLTTTSLLLLALPLGGALCTPPVDDAGPDNNSDCEVDLLFSAATAEEITLGETANGVLCPARDTDWFRFDVANPGSIIVVHLWMDTALTPVEPGYSIVTGADSPTGISARDEDKSAGEPVDFTGAHRVEAAGAYIIKIADVEGFDDRIDGANPYHLTVEVVADPDGFEPNESDDDATPVTPGTAVSGLIATNGDQDWYAVPVEADARIIDVTLTTPADFALALTATVIEPDGLTVVDTQPLAPAAEGATTRLARLRVPGIGTTGTRHFVRIVEDTGAASESDPALGTYELLVDVIADPDAQELGGRNDLPERATLVSGDQSFTGTVATLGDQDYFRVDPPVGTTSQNPRVLIAEVTFSGDVPDVVQPQLRVVTANPERADGQLPSCANCPGVCGPLAGGATGCLETYLQRLMTTQTSLRVAFPLRTLRPVFVVVNDFSDDGYQTNTSYAITFSVVDDPDPGEIGEDYLIPNLQTATYDNSEELEAQVYLSRQRARNISFPFVESCVPPDVQIVDGGAVVVDAGPGCQADAGCVEPTCQTVIPVPAPGPGGQIPYTVACNGQEYSTTASGRLGYLGDRDFFRFNLPESGYWAIDLTYDMSTTTPVELTLFVHDGSQVIGSTLEAPITLGECVSSTDCPAGSVCVDERCWGESESNPGFNDHIFPSPSQCLFMHVNGERPAYLEITDNGINDFDLDMAYNVNVRVRCGCPSTCDGAFSACQGTPPPAP